MTDVKLNFTNSLQSCGEPYQSGGKYLVCFSINLESSSQRFG